MKNTSSNISRLNTTTVLVLIIAALPVLLFALTQMFPPAVDAEPAKTTVSETKSARVSAAERRAQRAEARKAKKAEKSATVTTMQTNSFPAPMEPMDFGGFNGGFGAPGFDNGMAMAPGGFGGGFGGPGFGGPGFGGPF